MDAATGKGLLAVQPPEGVVIAGTPSAALSADGSVLAYGGRGKNGKGEVVVWSVDKNELLARFETAQAAPVFATLSADGRTLATHGPPPPAPKAPAENPPPAAPPPPVPSDLIRKAQVWDVEGVRELFQARVTGMGGMVVAAAFSPDGGRLAVSAGDGPVDVWEVKTGRRLHTLLGRKGQGVCVAFAPDGDTLASVAPDYRVQRWAADGRPLEATEPPPGMLVAQVTGLAFVDNRRAVAWQTAAQFAVAWEALTGRLLTPVTDHAAAVVSVAFPPDERDLFTSGQDGRVVRWNRPSGRFDEAVNLMPARLPGQPLIRPTVLLSADAKWATWPRTPAEVFDVATRADLFCVPPPSAAPATTSALVSADGTKVVTLCNPADRKRPGACAVWDLATRRRTAELALPPSLGQPTAALSPGGTRIVFATHTRNPATGEPALLFTGWDLAAGKKLSEVEAPAATGRSYLTAAGESSVIVCSSAGPVWAVDYEAGRVGPEIDRLPTRGEPAVAAGAAVSPDGKRFAVGVAGDGLENYGVRVYDWPEGRRTHTFMGHLGPVTALRFAPDGRSLATGSQDTSVLLWDLSKPAPGK